MRTAATTRAEPAFRRIDRPARAVPLPKQPTPPRPSRPAVAGRVTLVLLALTVGAIGVGKFWQWRAQRAFAQAEEQLLAAPPQRISDDIHRLCADEARRPKILARLLGSPREAIAQAAARELEAALLDIEMQGNEAAALTLVEEVGRELSKYGPTSRGVARGMAVRLLTLAGRGNGDLLDSCESVLRRTDVDSPPPGAPFDAPSVVETTPRSDNRAAQQLDEPWPELMHLPGGGLSASAAEVPSLPRSVASAGSDAAPRVAAPSTTPAESPPMTEPGHLPDTSPPGKLNSSGEIEMRLIDPQTESLKEPTSEELPQARVRQPRTNSRAVLPVGAEATAVKRGASNWREMTEPQLLDALRDGASAADVEAELQSRGFVQRQLELARRLTSSDAEERLEWTLRVPSFPDIEPVPWLVWLSEDADGEVRWTAVTLLGTADPEQAEAILRRLADDDPDAQIRRQAKAQLARLESRIR